MSELWIAAGILFIGIIAAYTTARVFKWLRQRADLTESKFDDILVLSFGKPIIAGIQAVTQPPKVLYPLKTQIYVRNPE